jgi:malonate decarboxylase acyl carrier protein
MDKKCDRSRKVDTMQELKFAFPSTVSRKGRAHVGIVASGDLEVLMTASTGAQTDISVITSVDGYAAIWDATLERFCSRNPVALRVNINDFGATPGMVLLRMQQALDSMEMPDA